MLYNRRTFPDNKSLIKFKQKTISIWLYKFKISFKF